jgi:hypothetical protein
VSTATAQGFDVPVKGVTILVSWALHKCCAELRPSTLVCLDLFVLTRTASKEGCTSQSTLWLGRQVKKNGRILRRATGQPQWAGMIGTMEVSFAGYVRRPGAVYSQLSPF